MTILWFPESWRLGQAAMWVWEFELVIKTTEKVDQKDMVPLKELFTQFSIYQIYAKCNFRNFFTKLSDAAFRGLDGLISPFPTLGHTLIINFLTFDYCGL